MSNCIISIQFINKITTFINIYNIWQNVIFAHQKFIKLRMGFYNIL
jgi:hypothetical protein